MKAWVPATGTGTITPAPLILFGVTAANKVYDTTTDATLNNGNVQIQGIIGSDQVTVSTSGAVAQFATANVGNGITVTVTGGYTLSGAQASNYQLVLPTGLTANITPAQLTILNVTANNKIYDGTTAATFNTRPETRSAYGPATVRNWSMNSSA